MSPKNTLMLKHLTILIYIKHIVPILLLIPFLLLYPSFDGLDYIQCYQQLSKWNDQHRNVQDASTWDDDVIVTYDTCNSIGILNP